jgi:hypothetical protein
MQSKQTRPTKNNTSIKRGFKKGTGFGSRIANTRNTENGTIVEKAHLSRDLDFHTQRLYA